MRGKFMYRQGSKGSILYEEKMNRIDREGESDETKNKKGMKGKQQIHPWKSWKKSHLSHHDFRQLGPILSL